MERVVTLRPSPDPAARDRVYFADDVVDWFGVQEAVREMGLPADTPGYRPRTGEPFVVLRSWTGTWATVAKRR